MADNTTNGNRRRGLTLLAIAVAIGGIAWGAHWFLYDRHFEDTDDAYVSSDIIQVTSEVPGTVLRVSVDDTQSVAAGQTLVELDPADAQVAMSAAEADLARTVRQVRALYAQREQLQASVDERRTQLDRANADYQRRESLKDSGAVSAEELAHSRDEIAELKAGMAGSQQQLQSNLAQTENTTLANHPQVLAAEARVRDASLALKRTRIIAPIAGVVAKRGVQIGQHIAAGGPLMAIVPLENAWVDANFKESQLADVRIGQPVTLKADLYGGDIVFHGKVVGLSAGSGSAFALLPAQNASGNWIKIVQRLPLRVALDAKELKDHPLRVGLSMQVKVDVADQSGPLVATEVRSVPLPVQASAGDDPGVQQRIDRIVAANAGSDGHGAVAKKL
jgi:membrane fusion protein (multidrug efflux system)